MKYFIDTHDKTKGSFPQGQLTEAEFFVKFDALEEAAPKFGVGAHAAHVVGAVCWLGLVWWWAVRGQLTDGRDAAVEACAIYWVFVCALWIALFGLVYQ